MSLLVNIQKTGETPSSYNLKVDTVQHSMVRMPIQSGLPGDIDNNSINLFGLDLGQCIEQITITGVVDEVPESGEPSKKNLESVVRSWWSEECNDQSTCTDGIGLTIDSVEVYWGAIKGCTFRRSGGIENRWDYSLDFIVIGRV
jgi:hypothetical protein